MKKTLPELPFKIIFSLFLLFFSFHPLAFAQIYDVDSKAALLNSKLFPAAQITALKVLAPQAYVDVKGGGTDQLVLEVYGITDAGRNLSDEEIEAVVARDFNIVIEEVDGILSITALRKAEALVNENTRLSFHILARNKLDSDLQIGAGSAHITRIQGDQLVQTEGGSIQLESVVGSVKARTSSGDIVASNIRGNVDLQGGHGSVHLSNIMGHAVLQTTLGSISGSGIAGDFKATSTGGSMRVTELNGKVNAHSEAGSIQIGYTALRHESDIATVSGGIRLSVPKSSKASFDLKGTNVMPFNLAGFEGTRSKDILQGSLNGGGVTLKAVAHSGDIQLNLN